MGLAKLVAAGVVGAVAPAGVRRGLKVKRYVSRARQGDIMRWFNIDYHKRFSVSEQAAADARYTARVEWLTSVFAHEVTPLVSLVLRDGVVNSVKVFKPCDANTQLVLELVVPAPESSFTRVVLCYNNVWFVGEGFSSVPPSSFVLAHEVDFGLRRRFAHRFYFEDTTQFGVEFSSFTISTYPADLAEYVSVHAVK